MTWGQLIYLLALSFQLSGALTLIIFCWGKTDSKILNIIYSATSMIYREDDNKVIIRKEKRYRAHKEVLLNRIAFILIAIGYILSLFGTNNDINGWIGVVILLVASSAIACVGFFFAHQIARYCNRNDRIHDFDYICSKLEKEVNTNMIKSELEEIIKILN